MKPSEVISKMEEEGISSLGHITMNGMHQYYVTVAWLKQINPDTEIKILSTEVKHLNTQDVVGRAPGSNKKRLYNVR